MGRNPVHLVAAALISFGLIFKGSSASTCLKISDIQRNKIDQGALDGYRSANYNFSVSIFKQLYNTPLASDAIGDQSNLVFSPHSIWQALILSYLISGSNMERSLERALGLEKLGKARTLSSYEMLRFFNKEVTKEVQSPTPPLADNSLYQLDTANRIYFEKSLEQYLNQDTLRLMKEEIKVVDFRGKAEETRLGINEWVSKVTRGKIPDLLSPQLVSPATIMALVNAAYFKGKWLNQFKKSDTEPATFILDNVNRDMITVPTMRLNDAFIPVGVSEALRCTVVELPYASGDGNDISMYFMIPASSPGWTLDSVLERLTPQALTEARESVIRKEITLLTVPKFKLATSFELLRPLNNLGLGTMFVPSEADFGCLSSHLTGTAFSVANHRAVIEVNEEGTEAAAATAFIAFRSGRIGPQEIKINRPFLYFLFHKDTDSILFMGVVRNPLLN